MELTEPHSEEEFAQYYELRWKILRHPWGQPRGSEKDEREKESIHQMAVEEGQVVGVGRGHLNTPDDAQIRYMAVKEDIRGKGIGGAILENLERKLVEFGAKTIVLNARENAVPFYKKHGYEVVGKSHTLFGEIAHKKMVKKLQ